MYNGIRVVSQNIVVNCAENEFKVIAEVDRFQFYKGFFLNYLRIIIAELSGAFIIKENSFLEMFIFTAKIIFSSLYPFNPLLPVIVEPPPPPAL